MIMSQSDRQRLYGLDLFRIFAAFMTFAFHGATHQLHLSFGLFDNFVSMGAIYMTGFFMLSGFVLYYVHGQCDTLNLYSLKRFYWKRFATAFFLA